ncbi:MAG: isoprenylcysteine carboxylmethyltransferase family protein [Brevinematales bacterium]|nr:isoprenylcysteine carboxylmethyltransferase family protein [Brevinematales bacterium]
MGKNIDLYKVIFIVFLVLLTLIRTYFKMKYYKVISKDYIKYEPVYIFVIRIILGVLLGILLFFIFFGEKYIAFTFFSLPNWLRFFGIFLTIIGLALLVWAHNTLKDNFTTTVLIKENHKLIKNGPYKYIRHPMYLSYLVFFTGLTFVSANYLFGILANSIILSLITLRLPLEEKILSQRFEEYKDYSKKVARFLPFIW